ncbi:nitrate- and nitrite sensing domain-containing protein [Streptomyces sp. NPDC055078]
MQKKRPQAPLVPETFQAQQHSPVPAARGRAKRVRSRLVAGVAVVSLVVIAAGTPGLLATSAELAESQRLVDLAGLNRQAVTLAHSLSDERDEVTAYIAAGREAQKGAKKDRRQITPTRSARVDRQIDEIRTVMPDDRAELRRELATVPSVRRTALTEGTAIEAHRAYTAVIGSLHALAGELAEKTPPRAPGNSRAPVELGIAVEQAAATRGQLMAALAVPSEPPKETIDPVTGLPEREEGEGDKAAARNRDALSAAAQQSRVRELAALADFDQAAGKEARDSLAATVTGAEVKSAESYLAKLTDRPELSDGDRESNRAKVESSLTARIEQMRGVESSLASDRIASLEKLRDDDVTALEARIAILGALVLLAIGVSAAVARTLTRPLAVLRLGAARLAASPETEEPVGFTGRNDEFAQVVRSLNTLHERVRDLGARAERLEGDHGGLTDARDALTAELATERAETRLRTEELTAELRRLRHTVDHTFVNLSLRTLGLVERQLGVIEKLEEREHDPERLATLFKLDHMATVMRRHSENLLVLAGAEHGHAHSGAVPLVDVLRAAVSEIERYERVVIQSLPPHAQVAGFAADDLSHLVAELLENATSFSPPDAQVELSGWLLESGEVMLSVQDSGIGMTDVRLAELNARLENPEAYEAAPTGDDTEGLGLRVAALLAARHGVRVQLREQKQGGVTAVVVLPGALLPKEPPAGSGPSMSDTGSSPAVQLPGSVAEANSNALPSSPRVPLPAPQPDAPAETGPIPLVDPLVEAAEAAVRAAEPETHERTADEGPERRGTEETSYETSYESAFEATYESTYESTYETTYEMRLPESPSEPEPEPYGGGVPSQPQSYAQPGPELYAQPGPAPETYTQPDPEPYTRSDPDPYARPLSEPDSYPHPDPAPHTPSQEQQQEQPQPPSPQPYAQPDSYSYPYGEPETPGSQPAPAPVAPGPVAGPAPAWEKVTDKGLPKRTPKVVKPAAAPGERKSSIDADALRRRLGGFQRGADQGRREAEAEIAGTATEEAGDTVEEARS